MPRSRLIIGAGVAVAAIVAAIFLWRAVSWQDVRKKGLQLAENDFSQAEPILKTTLAQAPNDVEILQALAKGYVKAKRRREAEEYLSQWLAQAPSEPEALLLRIEHYRDLGQFDKALADVDRLLEIDSQNITWRRKRITALFAVSRFADAEQECRKCLQRVPGDRGLMRSLSETMRAQGKLREAADILDSMLRDAPDESATLMARAVLFVEADEPAKAIPLFRKVLELDKSRQRTARYNLGLALYRVGETEEADRLMDEVRRMHEADVLFEDNEFQQNNLPLQVRNARAQFDNNDAARAAAILRQVLRADPNFGPAHALMADILDKQGRPDLAAQHRQRAKGAP